MASAACSLLPSSSSSSRSRPFSSFLSLPRLTQTRITQMTFPLSFPSFSLVQAEKPGRYGPVSVQPPMVATNVQVVVEENEPEDVLLNRFRREVLRAGIIQECKRRMHYENKQDKIRRKRREAGKRNRRRKNIPKPSEQELRQIQTPKKDELDFDDDNWDLPEGDLPY